MKKLTLIGLSEQRSAVLECLKRTASFHLGEIREKEEIGGAAVTVDHARREALLTAVAKVKFGIDFIERSKNEFGSVIKSTNKAAGQGRAEAVDYEREKSKKGLFTVRDDIDYDNFKLISTREQELIDAVEKLNGYNASLYAIRAEEAKLKNSRDNMLIYDGLDIKFSECGYTASSFVLVGTFHRKIYEKMIAEDPPEFLMKEINSNKTLVSVFVAGLKEEEKGITEFLAGYGFNRCQYTYSATASDLIKEWDAKIAENYAKRAFIYNETDKMGDTLRLLKIYYDYLSWELENVEAQESMLQTAKTYTLSGWYPEAREQFLLNALTKTSPNLIIDTSFAREDELPPTLEQNSKLVQPYAGITNMFSVPNAREINPNKYVGFFFALFFGVMLGDVGYGITLLIASLLAYRFIRMEKGTKSFMLLLAIGGASGIVWGVIYGGWFAFSNPLIPALLNPMEDAIVLLGLCLGLGALHLMTGLALKAAGLIKQKKYFDALCDTGFILLLFCAVILIVLNMLFFNNSALSLTGFIAAGIGVAGMAVFGGRAKKGVMGKITGGFGQIYGLINYVGDILSYSRLFSLAIAGGVIGLVANELAQMLWGSVPVLGHIAGILVFLVMHLFNLALSILSIYVHNSRLQFVEFFGKFYEGGGYEFTPMGSKTKYVRVTN